MKNIPYVSIITPAKNEEGQIDRCIQSLITQEYPKDKYEIIVVDGGSSDNTIKIMRDYDYPIKIVNGGSNPAEARNIGVTHSKGEILAFTDADCIATPDWLKNLVQKFETKTVGGVGGALRTLRVGSMTSLLADIMTQATYRGFITSNMAYKRDVFEEVGGFDSKLVCGEDWDLWWRVLDKGYKVPFEQKAIVYHAPIENKAILPNLKKEFWYAKSDVRVFAKRIGILLERRNNVTMRESWLIIKPSGINATIVLLFISSTLQPNILAVPTLWLSIKSIKKTITAMPYINNKKIIPALTCYYGVQSVIRGCGTIVGTAGYLLHSLQQVVLRKHEASKKEQNIPDELRRAPNRMRTLEREDVR